jgi:hypothetical protein
MRFSFMSGMAFRIATSKKLWKPRLATEPENVKASDYGLSIN